MSEPGGRPGDDASVTKPQQPTPPRSSSGVPAAQKPDGAKQTADPARATTSTPAGGKEHDPLRGSRVSGAWVAVVALVVLLVLLAIFVSQNTQEVAVSYLGWTGRAPLAVTLLLATALGLLIAVAAGSLRILQLRHRVRRERKG